MAFRSAILALFIPVVLTGCGVVAAFIPPIEVGDVFGVDGQVITATFAEPAALMMQVVTVADKTIERQFDDVELDMKGFSLSRLDSKISLLPTVTVTAPDADTAFPPSFSLTHISATASVSDTPNGSADLSTSHDVKVVFSLVQGSCAGLSCQYRYSSGDPLEGILNIQAANGREGSLRKFVQIIRLDGRNTPNQGKVSVLLKVDSEPGMAGFSVAFTLKSVGTTIKLGG